VTFRAILFSILCTAATFAGAQHVSVYIGEPHVSIGVNFPVYPQLVRVPGYPVYYAPNAGANVFFYDGMYWVYQADRWYASSWYNGPWGEVGPEAVPVYVLRVPVRYYPHPPVYFSGWAANAPPRWGEHWGTAWVQTRAGWDHWDRASVPAAAPLPVYQRQYSGARYPQVDQQVVIHNQQYRYQPRETVVRQYYQQRAAHGASAAANAPGQVKKQEGAQSARDYAPGHVKKQQGAQSPQAVVENEGNEGAEQGHGQGHGQSKGKGKGHGKD